MTTGACVWSYQCLTWVFHLLWCRDLFDAPIVSQDLLHAVYCTCTLSCCCMLCILRALLLSWRYRLGHGDGILHPTLPDSCCASTDRPKQARPSLEGTSSAGPAHTCMRRCTHLHASPCCTQVCASGKSGPNLKTRGKFPCSQRCCGKAKRQIKGRSKARRDLREEKKDPWRGKDSSPTPPAASKRVNFVSSSPKKCKACRCAALLNMSPSRIESCMSQSRIVYWSCGGQSCVSYISCISCISRISRISCIFEPSILTFLWFFEGYEKVRAPWLHSTMSSTKMSFSDMKDIY